MLACSARHLNFKLMLPDAGTYTIYYLTLIAPRTGARNPSNAPGKMSNNPMTNVRIARIGRISCPNSPNHYLGIGGGILSVSGEGREGGFAERRGMEEERKDNGRGPVLGGHT